MELGRLRRVGQDARTTESGVIQAIDLSASMHVCMLNLTMHCSVDISELVDHGILGRRSISHHDGDGVAYRSSFTLHCA